jgi:hypothetical protein
MAEFYTRAQIDAIATLIGQRIKAAVAGLGGGGISVVTFHADAGVNITLTNQAAGELSLASSNRNEVWFDGTGFTEARIVGRVVTPSASAASPRLRAQYSLTGTGGWTTLGSDSGNDVIGLGSAGAKRTDWLALPAEARADVVWRIAQIGGDGAADPAIGNLTLQFR